MTTRQRRLDLPPARDVSAIGDLFAFCAGTLAPQVGLAEARQRFESQARDLLPRPGPAPVRTTGGVAADVIADLGELFAGAMRAAGIEDGQQLEVIRRTFEIQARALLDDVGVLARRAPTRLEIAAQLTAGYLAGGQDIRDYGMWTRRSLLIAEALIQNEQTIDVWRVTPGVTDRKTE